MISKTAPIHMSKGWGIGGKVSFVSFSGTRSIWSYSHTSNLINNMCKNSYSWQCVVFARGRWRNVHFDDSRDLTVKKNVSRFSPNQILWYKSMIGGVYIYD